ncbi:MAG: hypothetical protein K2K13_01450 [Clostridiales bacterium]|nr:hypothetical protein [Clostridiales bacterium]
MGNQSHNIAGTAPQNNKISKLRIIFVVFLTVILVAAIVFDILVDKSSDFTEKEHLARVTDLAKKRYIVNGKYTDLQVYPIYNQDDKLQYFLIELEPVGYMMVYLHKNNIYSSMYSRSTRSEMYWVRYAVEIGSYAYIKEENGPGLAYQDARWLELDENNEPILHYSSPYKDANVLNEKLFLLTVEQKGRFGEIAAVKRDGKFFNLISMEPIDYKYKTDEILWPVFSTGIITEPLHIFDL